MTIAEQARARRAHVRARSTSLPVEAFERVLICARCRDAEAVMEADHLAAPGAHQWIDPAVFVCCDCVRVKA